MQVTGRPANLASGGTGVNNVGLGILNGLELEALWVVNDNLRIDATLGLLDASVDSPVNDSMASGIYTFFAPGFMDAVYSTAGSFATGNGNSALNLSRPREAYLRYQHWVGGR